MVKALFTALLYTTVLSVAAVVVSGGVNVSPFSQEQEQAQAIDGGKSVSLLLCHTIFHPCGPIYNYNPFVMPLGGIVYNPVTGTYVSTGTLYTPLYTYNPVTGTYYSIPSTGYNPLGTFSTCVATTTGHRFFDSTAVPYSFTHTTLCGPFTNDVVTITTFTNAVGLITIGSSPGFPGIASDVGSGE